MDFSLLLSVLNTSTFYIPVHSPISSDLPYFQQNPLMLTVPSKPGHPLHFGRGLESSFLGCPCPRDCVSPTSCFSCLHARVLFTVTFSNYLCMVIHIFSPPPKKQGLFWALPRSSEHHRRPRKTTECQDEYCPFQRPPTGIPPPCYSIILSFPWRPSIPWPLPSS